MQKCKRARETCLTTSVSGAFWGLLLLGEVDRSEVFRTLGQARWGQQPLRAAYCLHGTFCLVLEDCCGKSISCRPSWDWSRFPVYLDFASPRRLPGRKWSLQSEEEYVAADVKSKPLRPGTKGLQKPGSGAERGGLTWQRLRKVSSHSQGICVSVLTGTGPLSFQKAPSA